jgi:hypothetical protein
MPALEQRIVARVHADQGEHRAAICSAIKDGAVAVGGIVRDSPQIQYGLAAIPFSVALVVIALALLIAGAVVQEAVIGDNRILFGAPPAPTAPAPAPEPIPDPPTPASAAFDTAPTE